MKDIATRLNRMNYIIVYTYFNNFFKYCQGASHSTRINSHTHDLFFQLFRYLSHFRTGFTFFSISPCRRYIIVSPFKWFAYATLISISRPFFVFFDEWIHLYIPVGRIVPPPLDVAEHLSLDGLRQWRGKRVLTQPRKFFLSHRCCYYFNGIWTMRIKKGLVFNLLVVDLFSREFEIKKMQIRCNFNGCCVSCSNRCDICISNIV